jgi:DNA-binding Xre family transcriptional regulator
MRKAFDEKFVIEFEKYGDNFKTEVSLNDYISFRIKEIKKQKKLGHEEITKRGDFSNTTVLSRILKGSHSINIETLAKLCKGLDCKASDLLPF